jgi:hypothetical protein
MLKLLGLIHYVILSYKEMYVFSHYLLYPELLLSFF